MYECKISAVFAVLSALVLFSGGCYRVSPLGLDEGDDEGSTDGDSDSEGQVDADADSDSDNDADTGIGTDHDADYDQPSVCDVQAVAPSESPVEVVFLLGTPESMDQGSLDEVVGVISSVVTEWESSTVRFGFDSFPNGESGCSVSEAIQVPPGLETAESIVTQMDALVPFGSSPVAQALNNYNEPQFIGSFPDQSVMSYVVMVVSDEPSCGYPDVWDLEGVSNTLDENGVRTVVVGYDTSGEALDALALNGGMTHPYDDVVAANDEQSLFEAVEDALSWIVECVFEVPKPADEADPKAMTLYLGEEQVSHNDLCNGQGLEWRWADKEHENIELCELACDLAREEIPATVKLVWECVASRN